MTVVYITLLAIALVVLTYPFSLIAWLLICAILIYRVAKLW